VNTAQRIVLVVALGIALVAIAGAANLAMDYPVDGGWFAYAPNTGATFSPSQTDSYFAVGNDGAILRQAAIWLLAIGTWAGASVWLLRTRAEGDTDD
jgi:hypothetical protein